MLDSDLTRLADYRPGRVRETQYNREVQAGAPRGPQKALLVEAWKNDRNGAHQRWRPREDGASDERVSDFEGISGDGKLRQKSLKERKEALGLKTRRHWLCRGDGDAPVPRTGLRCRLLSLSLSQSKQADAHSVHFAGPGWAMTEHFDEELGGPKDEVVLVRGSRRSSRKMRIGSDAPFSSRLLL